MRFNKLDLNLLVALDALLTERSISRAAERVHLSQSTMSHALARLREHFKDELLVQVGRKMEYTPRAASLCDPVRDVLVRIGTTIDIETVFDPARSERELVLHVSDYSMELLFPHVFALAESQRSKVRFRLQPQTGNPARALERGEVDMLVIPDAYCSADHPTEPLFQEHYEVVMCRRSRLAQSELTIERYVQGRHVVMEPVGTGPLAYERWLIERHGISRDIAVRTYSFTVQPAMVVGTELMTTVHSRLAQRAASQLPLKVVPLPLEIPPLNQALQWHKHRSNDPGIAWLRSLLKEATVRMDHGVQTHDGLLPVSRTPC